MLDLSVINGSVVLPHGVSSVDVGIQGGSVALLAQKGSLPPAHEKLDASGLLVFPGVIDSHVHFRAPAHPEWEDFDSGSGAAAAGGVTTFIEMPNSNPPVTTAEKLKARAQLGAEQARVDFALYAGGATCPSCIASTAGAGAAAYKIFTHSPISSRAAEFEGLIAVREGEILQAFRAIAPTGLVCAVHAEDDSLIHALEEQMLGSGRRDIFAHADSRPEYVEELAIQRVLTLAQEAACPVHILHVTTGKGIELIREAKRQGQKVTAEACLHHLIFDRDTIESLGPYAKINPPLRSRSDVELVWEGIMDGTINTVSSDHCGYREEDKEPGWADIWPVPPGVGGIQVLLPLFLTHAANRELSLARASAVLSENPARIFRLWPRKGALIPGSDADLVLLQPGADYGIDIAQFLNRGTPSAKIYAGLKMTYKVETTIVRGKRVFDKGNLNCRPGCGQFIPAHGRGPSK